MNTHDLSESLFAPLELPKVAVDVPVPVPAPVLGTDWIVRVTVPPPLVVVEPVSVAGGVVVEVSAVEVVPGDVVEVVSSWVVVAVSLVVVVVGLDSEVVVV